MLDGLSRLQRAAVTHPGGPLLVIAGAGAGKTLLLVRRVAWLVGQGLPADSLLTLTFSSEAASGMREQLEALLELPYEELHVGTFHAFCTRLLQDEALEAGVDPFLSPVTPADRLALLHEHPHVRESVGRRFRHVLVDEYQDMGFAQGMLLPLLVEGHRNVTVAGDDDQAIHRFRSAAQKNLLDFQREFPDAEVIRLERSHRSGRRILQAAEAVVAPAADRIPKKLTAATGGRARFWRCRSERAQAQAIAAEAEQLIAGGVAPNEICVLVRSVKQESSVLASALEERAVPSRTCGAAAYFQRAEVRDVLAWLRTLADPNDSGAVVRALSRPPIELRSVDVARLTQLARRRKLDMPSAVASALE